MRTGLARATLAVLLGLLAGPVEAQRREMSVLLGPTYTGASGPLLAEVSEHVGFLGGLSLRLPRSHRISLEADFLVVHHRLTGTRFPSDLPPEFAGPEADFAKVTFVEVPLMFRFQEPYRTYAPVRPFLQLGGSIAVRLKCDREIRPVSGSDARPTSCSGRPVDSEPFAPSVYQNMDVAVHAGAGVEIGRLALFVRGKRSLRNLVETGAFPSSPLDGAKMWALSAGVDYLVKVF
jgi:hypothetical protein